MRLFGGMAKLVRNGFIQVCNHFILFWRCRGKLVILHRHSGHQRKDARGEELENLTPYNMGKKVRISDESVNCYGTRVLTSGIDLTQYQRNPVLLYMHERGKVVGLVKNLEVKDGELLGELVFDKASPLSVQLEKQYQFGSLRMVSANFRILETSGDKALVMEGQTCETVTRSELFEVSAVDIGGNDNALVLSDRDGKQISLVDAAGRESLLPLLNNNVSNNNPLKKTEMEPKQLALALGLAETATEAEITAKVNEMKLAASKMDDLQKKVDQLTKEQLEAKEKADAVALANVESAVDTAIKEKRLDASMKSHFVELGKKVGLDTLKLTLSAMQPQGRISAVVNHGGGRQTRVGVGSYQKLSDVPCDELLELRSNNRQEYIALYKAEFGFEPKFD